MATPAGLAVSPERDEQPSVAGADFKSKWRKDAVAGQLVTWSNSCTFVESEATLKGFVRIAIPSSI